MHENFIQCKFYAVASRIDPSEARQRLFAVAESQGGYFTSSQAKSCGYSHRLQSFHASRGNWLRAGRGIYRLRDFPVGQREDLVRWNFWSGERGVISHESALEFHGFGDVMPERVHLTVPPGFRKRSPDVVLHRKHLGESDVERHPGFRVTTPLQTLLDAAESPLEPDRLALAVRQGLSSNRIRGKTLVERSAELNDEARRRLAGAIAASERA